MTDAGRHVAPGPWTSGDCRVARHGSCVLPDSCRCRCHRRPNAPRALRAPLPTKPARALRSSEQVNAMRDVIVGVFHPGELLTTADVIARVERLHPGRWPRSYLSQYVCHVARSGRIVNHARGVYTLPR